MTPHAKNKEVVESLKCPLCTNSDFQKEEGRVDSQWGATNHKVDMYVCNECGYVMLFSVGRSYIGSF